MEDSRSTSAATLIQPLAAWLETRTPGATNVQLHDAVEPSQGFSSKTVIFRATWNEGGQPREQRLVVRVQKDTDCPMLADVFTQYHVMKAIAENSDVAVPPILAAETDPSILGAPFFLMERVDGRPTPDFPVHHESGWYKEELTPGLREHAWWNAVTEMSRLHAIDWRCFTSLNQGVTEAPQTSFYINDFCQKWYDWGSQGRDFPVIKEAMRRLIKNQPQMAQSGLVWNDARMGNTLFANNLTVTALLDFEVPSLGPAEIDIASWLYMEDVFSIVRGVPRIEGVPTRENAIKGFERIYGRPMVEFDYFEAVAALKHAVIFLRSYGNDKETGAVESVHLDFATGHLQRYLDQNP
ncbi:MAG: hypothetical protein VR73_13645 [Gammaproteobacteria bacterium BRH_c0]|nr:MAG: hypothetical protein VR73_13645 [Gammaproteobacteria bacterium BRH_c0]